MTSRKHTAAVAVLTMIMPLGAAISGSAQWYGHDHGYDHRNFDRGVAYGGRGDYYDRGHYYHGHGIGTGRGALIGGAGGAVLGALFGGGAKGALIGGAAGAGIGAIAGHEHQVHERHEYYRGY